MPVNCTRSGIWNKVRHQLRPVVAAITAAVTGFGAGWFAFEARTVAGDAVDGPLVRQQATAALVVFLMGWHLARHAGGAWSVAIARGALLGAFMAGGSMMIPHIWADFFPSSPHGGWAAWLALGAVQAGACALTIQGLRRAAQWRPWRGAALAASMAELPASLLVTALPPLGIVGICSPLMLSGALFSGWGVAGYLAMLTLCALSALPGRWLSLSALVFAAGFVTTSRQPRIHGLPDAHGVVSHVGQMASPGGLASFDQQDAFKGAALEAMRSGYRLLLLPEGVHASWDSGMDLYWQDVARAATQAQAAVFVGAYRMQSERPGHAREGINMIRDLRSGREYPARISIPFGMWRPWASEGVHFPMRWTSSMVALPDGRKAGYLICFESALVWPLLTHLADHSGAPMQAIIYPENRWFEADSRWLAPARSAYFQAALWRVSVLRATNYSSSTP